jgi:hypothetical protein
MAAFVDRHRAFLVRQQRVGSISAPQQDTVPGFGEVRRLDDLASNPSISASIWLRVWSRSSLDTTCPPRRCPIASISSMNTVRVLEEVDHLGELPLGAFIAGHIRERRRRPLRVEHLAPGTAEPTKTCELPTGSAAGPPEQPRMTAKGSRLSSTDEIDGWVRTLLVAG